MASQRVPQPEELDPRVASPLDVSRPIGMFDSGFGGLTVARATIDLLPGEDLVYLGDTARYPYGSRSLDEVRAYSVEIAEYLVGAHDIKLLVVACNTATAAALDLLTDTLPIPVVGVIEPGVSAVVNASRSGRIGVIGTVGTVSSGAYEKAMAAIQADAELVSLACPRICRVRRTGRHQWTRGRAVGPPTAGPAAGLGHRRAPARVHHYYPYLARVIADVVGRQVVLVSSADETAFALADHDATSRRTGRTRPRTAPADREFISSGDVRSFTKLGSRLLGPELVDATLWRPRASSPDPAVPVDHGRVTTAAAYALHGVTRARESTEMRPDGTIRRRTAAAVVRT